MKHILIITQYYPLPQRPDIPEGGDAVRGLCGAANEEERVTVLFCHVYRRMDAVKRFFSLLREKPNWRGRLYHDENGADILLCEHPSVLPRICSTYPCFNRKFAAMLDGYMREKGIMAFDTVAVHFPTRHAGIVKRVPAKRRVAVLHAFDVKSRWRMLRMKRLAAGYDAVLCRAPWITWAVKRRVPELQPEVCLSGLPAWMLEKDRRKARAWKREGVLHLLFAGRLNRNKNVEVILRAVHMLAAEKIPLHLTVLGEGEREGRLKEQTAELGISGLVTFAGRRTREETYKRMEEADAFIMLSKSETLGLVYLEAMAAGAIVVASRGRGVDGLVREGESGFLAEWNDAAELSQILRRLASMDETEAQTIRAAAFETVKGMDGDSMSRRYLNRICALGQGRKR